MIELNKSLIYLAIASLICAAAISIMQDSTGNRRFNYKYSLLLKDLSSLSDNIDDLDKKIGSLPENDPMRKAFAEVSDMKKGIETIKNSASVIEEKDEFKIVAGERQKLGRVKIIFLILVIVFVLIPFIPNFSSKNKLAVEDSEPEINEESSNKKDE